jgi:argininosuccinate synthase
MEASDLENAINNAKVEAAPDAAKEAEAPQMSKEEEIGFHKGALNTLVAERNELVKMVGNVEAIMQAHMKRLEELGVKLNGK